MFKEERDQRLFEWKDLGNIEEGRPNLGPNTTVAVYRLMQYTLRDVLICSLGVDKTNALLYDAGKLAGVKFCENMLDTSLDFDAFISDMGEKLLKLSIGVLRMETADLERLEIVLTVSEDLDCSGLPVSDESICAYDEGFIAGILETYAGVEFFVREIDCWATGERTCRFRAVPAR